ncbi:MAG TPA: FkbM family methyltransferase [Vicingus sp.]|nr:FkbM family methyltransferase [Vicingus sp.]
MHKRITITNTKINKKTNNCNNIEIVKAICDESSGQNKGFSINPVHSQDNRVEAPSTFWRKENVITTSIDSIIENHSNENFVFIKIDTQGFEKSVFQGAKKFLSENSNWLIKTEFSPYHLEKQGTNPKEFLSYLINNYSVVELVGILNYNSNSIDELFKYEIKSDELENFYNHIIRFNTSNTGWVDLLIRKKY